MVRYGEAVGGKGRLKVDQDTGDNNHVNFQYLKSLLYLLEGSILWSINLGLGGEAISEKL